MLFYIYLILFVFLSVLSSRRSVLVYHLYTFFICHSRLFTAFLPVIAYSAISRFLFFAGAWRSVFMSFWWIIGLAGVLALAAYLLYALLHAERF